MWFRLFKLLVLSLWFFIGLIVFAASLKADIIFTDNGIKEKVKLALPQGWGFFTKNPQENAYLCFRPVGKDFQLLTIQNCSSENYFGFSRKARVLAFETGQIVEKVFDSKKWQKRKGKINLDVAEENILVLKLNRKFNYLKDERIILIRFLPIPWAWHGNKQENFRPYEILSIQLS